MTRGPCVISVGLGQPPSLMAVVLSVAGLDGCSGSGTALGETDGPTAAPETPTPLATSVQTSDGTWATIPMGRLDEPLNTFWQLFYRPNGSVRWSNRVEATATATNGGLVLASAGPSLLVGVRPSVDLTFTPLISTSDGGRSWSDGLVAKEMAARPDALATAAGHALALVNSRCGGPSTGRRWRHFEVAGPGHPGRPRPGQCGEVLRPRLAHVRRLPGGSAPRRRELRSRRCGRAVR